MPDWPRAGLSPHVAAWGGVSRVADLGGPVHYVDFGGAAEAPRVVLVHGLGGTHLNWCLLAPLLVPHARVLALDLVGFGLTYPEGRSATVQANAALVARFVREVAGGPGRAGRQFDGRDGVDPRNGCPTRRGHRPDPDRVPLEYSIGQLTCTIASRLAAVMVGWPVGFQKSAYSCDLGRRARHGRGA